MGGFLLLRMSMEILGLGYTACQGGMDPKDLYVGKNIEQMHVGKVGCFYMPMEKLLGVSCWI